jgi:hypothetical protein
MSTAPRLDTIYSRNTTIHYYLVCLQAAMGKPQKDIIGYAEQAWTCCGMYCIMNYEAFMFQFVTNAMNELYITDIVSLRNKIVLSRVHPKP